MCAPHVCPRQSCSLGAPPKGGTPALPSFLPPAGTTGVKDDWGHRTTVYSTRHEHDKAIVEYTEAIRIDPKMARAYYNRAGAYEDKGDYDKADADFARAKELGYK